MDFYGYLDKMVHLIIDEKFAYVGKVVDVGKNHLVLIDKNNSRVTISLKSIEMIKEIQ